MAAVVRLNRLEAVGVAVTLLMVALMRHYGYVPLPPELRGVGSKALGSAAALILLSGVVLAWRHKLVFIAAAYYAFEELQSLLCSLAYMVDPWPVAKGQSLCSAKVGFDLGAFGIMLAGLVLWFIVNPANQGYKGRK